MLPLFFLWPSNSAYFVSLPDGPARPTPDVLEAPSFTITATISLGTPREGTCITSGVIVDAVLNTIPDSRHQYLFLFHRSWLTAV